MKDNKDLPLKSDNMKTAEDVMTKFRVGDQVRVINYGHPIYGSGGIQDMCPQIVGEVGLIVTADKVQGTDTYAIDGIKGKHSWYDNNQLELVHRPSYRI